MKIKIIIFLLIPYVIGNQKLPAKETSVLKISYEETIKKTLLEYGVSEKQAILIVAQAKHESANFTSAIFVENNNPFGMKLPKRRPTVAIGENRKHAVYTSLEEAVYDYVLWIEYTKFPKDIEDVDTFVKLLKKKKYYEDKLSNYKKGLTVWYQEKSL